MSNKEQLAQLKAQAAEKANAYLKELMKGHGTDSETLLQLRTAWDDAEAEYLSFMLQTKTGTGDLKAA